MAPSFRETLVSCRVVLAPGEPTTSNSRYARTPEPVTVPPGLAMETRIWPGVLVLAARLQPGVRLPVLASRALSTLLSKATVRLAAARPWTLAVLTGTWTMSFWPPLVFGRLSEATSLS